jgi:carboxyl-terminal processing protease
VPDVWLDETAEGNVFAALRMREADLDKHLQGADEKKDERARQGARGGAQEARGAAAKSRESPPKPLPEFGSPEDFPLQQALNQLRGLPVMASKTARAERKAEADVAKQ